MSMPCLQFHLSTNQRQLHEGNFDCFEVISHCHVCKIINGELDLVTFSSLPLFLFRLYGPTDGTINSNPISAVYLVAFDVC